MGLSVTTLLFLLLQTQSWPAAGALVPVGREVACVDECVRDEASTRANSSLTAKMNLQETDHSTAVYYYDEFPLVDVLGHDIARVLDGDVVRMKQTCSAMPDCKGFNANGWLKSSVSDRIVLTTSLFVKVAPQLVYDSKGLATREVANREEELNMLQHMAVYVYDPPPALDVAPMKDYKYATESLFEKLLRQSTVRTWDPSVADFLFVPVRCSSHRFLSTSRTEGQRHAEQAVRDWITHIEQVCPTCRNRSLYSDHVYACAHDMGASCTASADAHFRKNSIAMVNTAEYSDAHFVPHKDVAMPSNPGDGCPTCTQGASQTPLEPDWSSERPQLASFVGNMGHGSLRTRMRELWGHDQDVVLVDGFVNPTDYHALLHRSKFCLLLRGHRGWSPRLGDAIWAGCVPVIVADHYQLPLHELVDWTQFSVQVPEQRVGELKHILQTVSAERYEHLRQQLRRVWRRFVWNDPPQQGDAFHSLLTLLWRRRHLVRQLA
jgi:hypothetical protein